MKTRSMNTNIIPMQDFYKTRNFISELFGIAPDLLESKYPGSHIIKDARKCLAFILTRYYRMSYESAGKLLGGLDHSSISNCLKTYSNYYENNKEFRKKANLIISFVKIHISKRPQLCPFCNHEIKNEDK